jgi:hypothetical protein
MMRQMLLKGAYEMHLCLYDVLWSELHRPRGLLALVPGALEGAAAHSAFLHQSKIELGSVPAAYYALHWRLLLLDNTTANPQPKGNTDGVFL